MAAGSTRLGSEGHTDRYPLLMEHMPISSDQEHVVLDVSVGDPPLSPTPQGDATTTMDSQDRMPSSSTPTPSRPVPSSSSLRSTSFSRTGDLRNYGHRQRPSPLNSGLWISIELTITVSQIVASIIVLSLSRNEKPQAPLSVWVVGYAAGCLATLPLLYWRYAHRYVRVPEQDSLTSTMASHSSPPSSPRATPYTTISVPHTSVEEEGHGTSRSLRRSQDAAGANSRINTFVERFKMALDCFFAVWFVVGNICCICLGKYKDGVELRELPCTHHFHVECVDKWLKINASCPLCKHEIVESSEAASASVGETGQHGEG